MNILIVDDKYEVVQGIKEGVDWDRLGDITLFEAYSGLEALQCFKENEIDLLVTWLFRLTNEYYNYKMASVIGIVVFIICAAFTLITFTRTIKGDKEEEYQ